MQIDKWVGEYSIDSVIFILIYKDVFDLLLVGKQLLPKPW